MTTREDYEDEHAPRGLVEVRDVAQDFADDAFESIRLGYGDVEDRIIDGVLGVYCRGVEVGANVALLTLYGIHQAATLFRQDAER